MRLRACLGLVLLATSACVHLPDHIRIEVDENVIDFRKKKPIPSLPDE